MYRKAVLLTLMFQTQIKWTNEQDDSKRINLKECGVSHKSGEISQRIVGGTKVNITRYPWTVSIQKWYSAEESEHFCGGSIINKRWLLTASHCIQGVKYSIKKVRAVVGTTEWNGPDGVIYEVDKFFMHEKYDAFNYANDIALIKTKTEIKFKSDSQYYYINSICLPKPNTPLPKTGNVYGWGLLGEFESGSFELMKTSLDRVNITKCNQVYEEFIGTFTKQMMCYSTPGKDACQGDSGGPLSHLVNGKEYQIGIVSFGLGCGRPENPGIYTNVALYEEWIKKTITNN